MKFLLLRFAHKIVITAANACWRLGCEPLSDYDQKEYNNFIVY